MESRQITLEGRPYTVVVHQGQEYTFLGHLSDDEATEAARAAWRGIPHSVKPLRYPAPSLNTPGVLID